MTIDPFSVFQEIGNDNVNHIPRDCFPAQQDKLQSECLETFLVLNRKLKRLIASFKNNLFINQYSFKEFGSDFSKQLN